MGVKKDFVFACEESPHSDIEFSLLIEKRSFHILLHHQNCQRRARVNKSSDVVDLREYFNAFPLISICGFHQPDVIYAMLYWNSFFWCVASLNVLVPLGEVSPFAVFNS